MKTKESVTEYMKKVRTPRLEHDPVTNLLTYVCIEPRANVLNTEEPHRLCLEECFALNHPEWSPPTVADTMSNYKQSTKKYDTFDQLLVDVFGEDILDDDDDN